MAERGRYDYDITTGRRTNEGGGRSSDRSNSMFGDWRGSGDAGSGGGSGGGSGEDEGGRSGERSRGGWAQERENFSWGRSGGSARRNDERASGGDRGGAEYSGGGTRGSGGERMSSGWGPGLGERRPDMDRDHHNMDRGQHMHSGQNMHHRMDGRGMDGRETEHRDSGRERQMRAQQMREREMGREQDQSPRYGRDDDRPGLPIDETSRLIASNKVEGTAVYGRDDHRLGSIFNFMVDKRSGRVEYAVMRYGGTLGMGQRYYPLPWQILTYDTGQGGYRIEMTERDLRDAPSFDRETEPRFDENYGDRVHGWYGLRRR